MGTSSRKSRSRNSKSRKNMIKKINPRFCLKPNVQWFYLKGSQLLFNSNFLKHILIKALGDNF